MNWKSLILWLNIFAASTAFIAAFFWFISAATKAPEVDDTWGGITENPRKIVGAITSSAKWNRFAAGFAGVSAALTAAATICGLRA
jgi:hypothetical protein